MFTHLLLVQLMYCPSQRHFWCCEVLWSCQVLKTILKLSYNTRLILLKLAFGVYLYFHLLKLVIGQVTLIFIESRNRSDNRHNIGSWISMTFSGIHWLSDLVKSPTKEKWKNWFVVYTDGHYWNTYAVKDEKNIVQNQAFWGLPH